MKFAGSWSLPTSPVMIFEYVLTSQAPKRIPKTRCSFKQNSSDLKVQNIKIKGIRAYKSPTQGNWLINILWIVCTKGICSRVLTYTIDRSLINTWSISWSTLAQHLDRHVIDTWSSVGQYTAECQLTHMYWSIFNGITAKISGLSTNVWLRCRPSVNQHVDQVLIAGWLRVSIATWLWMPWVHKSWSHFVYSSNIVRNMHSSTSVYKII